MRNRHHVPLSRGSSESPYPRDSDKMLADAGGATKCIELSLSQQTGTSSDLHALSSVELPDELFRDRFEIE